ncbi:hypothetical protein ACWD4O_45425 [Streptomyces sp. NPDC002623]
MTACLPTSVLLGVRLLARRPGRAALASAGTAATAIMVTALLTAVLAILTVVGALTALPAWAHTRSPAGRALNAEPAV